MPELPEVQTVVTTLVPRVVGRSIRSVRLMRNDIVTPPGVDLVRRLTGRTVRAIDRRGKRIIFTLDDGNCFYIHLGMTGRLTLHAAEEAVEPHTHLVLEIAQPRGKPSKVNCQESGARGRPPADSPLASDSRLQLRFRDPRRFGGVWWLGGEPPDTGMGPEPLGVKPKQLGQRLAKTTRAIKNALLDQRVLAGLGNIYVDEALFAAGVHPLSRADRLTDTQVSKLNRCIKAVLRRALRHRGSTLRDYVDADGQSGGFQKLHHVYDRAGKPCRKCGAPIERLVLGGRSTHFCPRCQPPAQLVPASRHVPGRSACES